VNDLDRFLEELHRFGLEKERRNVRPGDGRFLQVITGAARARRVLELGTSSGYSGIWIGRALRETGGQLLTIEIDEERAREARANFEKAGMADLIEVRVGDARKLVPTLPGPFDLVFLDSEKADYLGLFRMAFPLLEPGGLFLAHNVVLMRDSMKDFLEEIQSRPDLATAIAQTSDDGFSVSYRRR
jgi:caffeoyl-CoA O-methyltransferase